MKFVEREAILKFQIFKTKKLHNIRVCTQNLEKKMLNNMNRKFTISAMKISQKYEKNYI